MFVRVRDFSRAHPAADANYTIVLGQLEEGITRMQTLAKQQQEGVATAHASTVRRRALRRRVHHELLRHLVTVAGVAAAEQPAMADQFDLPDGNETNEVFRTLARRLLEKGLAQKDLLAKHGLAEKLLEDLGAAVDELDASVTASNEGRREHVGARAELRAMSDELMVLVEMLDGVNRYRFSGNAELQAAWRSARKVVVGPRAAEAATEAPQAVAPQAASGDVRPAA